MKKVILYAITIFVATIWASETCQGAETTPNPPYSCEQTGYVCNLGINVNGENSIMYFHLGADSSCSILLTSNSLKTFKSELDSSYSVFTKFYLIENENKMGPLSLTLASSLAMLAVNNSIPVNVIYKKVGEYDFGGIKLLSISLVNH